MRSCFEKVFQQKVLWNILYFRLLCDPNDLKGKSVGCLVLPSRFPPFVKSCQPTFASRKAIAVRGHTNLKALKEIRILIEFPTAAAWLSAAAVQLEEYHADLGRVTSALLSRNMSKVISCDCSTYTEPEPRMEGNKPSKTKGDMHRILQQPQVKGKTLDGLKSLRWLAHQLGIHVLQPSQVITLSLSLLVPTLKKRMRSCTSARSVPLRLRKCQGSRASQIKKN